MKAQQVVYEIPEMQNVVVQQGHVFHEENHTELKMDIYQPPNSASESPLPVVIFTFGFADSLMQKQRGYKLMDSGQYVSWSCLVAASGFTAITYETNQPEQDIVRLINYLRANADLLNIDRNKIGLWACSGNVPTALSILMLEPHEYLKCMVLYYGAMLDWPGSQIVANAAVEAGFANPCKNYTYDDLPDDVPMLIVRAGQDYPPLNQTIDRFIQEAVIRNMPVTFINFPSGEHGFDILDDSESSQGIIKTTLTLMKEHLHEK